MILNARAPRPVAKRRARRAGLSLFELLMSLALLAAISTALAASLGLSIRVNDRAQTLGTSETPVIARLHLRRYLRLAAPPVMIAPFDTGFSGTATDMHFTTLAPAGFAPDAAALRVHVAVDGSALFMHVDLIGDDGASFDRLTLPLGKEMHDLQLAYFNPGALPSDGTATWQSTWSNDAPSLPTAVRITASQSMPDWPDFIARLTLGPGR